MKLDPYGGDVRKLGGATYRRRVGAYRIIFDLQRDVHTL
jgi:mRNA-degrading endonuclease RelE of RelBE toxin-antitoxin system